MFLLSAFLIVLSAMTFFLAALIGSGAFAQVSTLLMFGAVVVPMVLLFAPHFVGSGLLVMIDGGYSEDEDNLAELMERASGKCRATS